MTLPELMMTLSIAAISLSIGVPSLDTMLERAGRTSVVMDVGASVRFARSEAARRGVPISICPSEDGTTCVDAETPEWNKGWLVFVDADQDLNVDEGDEIVDRTDIDHARFSLTGSDDIAKGISFRASGYPVDAGSLNYCDESESRNMVLGYVGRMNVYSVDGGCS